MYNANTPTSRPQLNEETATGILSHLDSAVLAQLLENDAKLDELINDLQQVKNIQIEKQNLLTSNKSLADYNLSLEPRLVQERSQLAETYEKGVTLEDEYKSLKLRLEGQQETQSLDTTLALLQTEAAKSEEDSEETADKFLDGNIELEEFIDSYGAQRKLAHLRKAKAEKMSELMRYQQRNTNHISNASNGPSNSIPHTSYNAIPPPVTNYYSP